MWPAYWPKRSPVAPRSDVKLRRALQPLLEEALQLSVQSNPRMLADALFPIFGKAIRKAIASELDGMLQSLSQTLEQSFSWRSVQWRWESFRTGKPYAEIVVLRSLLYRVEQVFLIHRNSGLLLQHVAASVRASRGNKRSGNGFRHAHRDPGFRARFGQRRRERELWKPFVWARSKWCSPTVRMRSWPVSSVASRPAS